MARKIIVLDQTPAGNDIVFGVAYWLDVPAARQALLANPGTRSRVSDITPGELTALQNGSIVEQGDTIQFAANTSLGAMETELQSQFATRQAALNADKTKQRYGSAWDGTTWTIKNIA